MFARQAVRAARNATQRRTISGLVDKESKIAESQKLFTSSHKPTYSKRDSDKLMNLTLWGLFGFGTIQFIRGEINMACGTGKKE